MSHLQIVLVEDNANDLELTLRALRKRKLANDIVTLRDGAAALDYLFGRGEYEGRDTSRLPTVLLLDLKLPKVDGLEVLRQIKADPRLKTIPVVVLTSSIEERDRLRSYDLGANSFIVKPIEFDAFSEAVCELGFYWLAVNRPPQ